ncbi:unnamed protein product, partial [Oppiella nova]
MSAKPVDTTLQLATRSATYNILLQISLRIVTFVANAVILRSISRDVFGVINVRLLLLYTTIQFLSREPFRRVSTGATKTHDWPQVVRLISLSIPLSLVFGTILSLIWYHTLERPDPQLCPDYRTGIVCIFSSVVIELLAEPLYVWAQTQGFIKLKVMADGLFLMTRTLLMVALVSRWPQKAILVFSGAQICASLSYLCLYYVYFIYVQKRRFSDFMPKMSAKNQPYIDRSLIIITISFLKNTTLKQFLTEGERFVMTFLRVLTFAEQGVYDVVNNIGSLPARMILQPIEESGFVLFTQKMDRQKAPADQTPSDLAESALILRNFIKIMSLLGLIILIFGVNYSELALLIYGGRPLSAGDNGLATGLLQWHSLYILFIAINGITECFTFAAMNSRQLDAFNKNMIYISVVFLMSSYLLTKWWGSQGFIMANCLNMGSRIAISTKVVEPLNGSIPHQGSGTLLGTYLCSRIPVRSDGVSVRGEQLQIETQVTSLIPEKSLRETHTVPPYDGVSECIVVLRARDIIRVPSVPSVAIQRRRSHKHLEMCLALIFGVHKT